MTLEIQYIRGTCAQFSSDLGMRATDGNASIDFDVTQKEMLDFALLLLDIAEVCVLHYEKDTGDAPGKIGDAIDAVRLAAEQ